MNFSSGLDEWAVAMGKLLDQDAALAMGMAARRHVLTSFSRESFGQKLDQYIRQLVSTSSATSSTATRRRGGAAARGKAR